MASMKGRRWLAPVIVALVAAAIYLPTVGNDFTIDDFFIVRDNPDIASLDNIPGHFVAPYWPGRVEAGMYRPLTILSLTVNRALTGPEPWGYHLVNLLLHASVSALVWYCVLGAAGRPAAWGAALLFAVHPLHTEAVTNITGRSEVLASLWVLAAWLAHRVAAGLEAAAPRARVAVLGGAFYLMALLSKESIVLAPLVFLVDDRVRMKGRTLGERLARSGPSLAAYAVSFGLAILLRANALGSATPKTEIHFLDSPMAFAASWVRIATALWIQVKYALLFVWPASLSSEYSYDAIPLVESVGDVRLWAGGMWAALLIGAFALGWKNKTPIALSIAIWVAFLLPSSNLLFPAGVTLGERLAYLPSLGGCLLVGCVGSRYGSLLENVRPGLVPRAVLSLILATLLVPLSVRTVTRNAEWKNNFTLTQADAALFPRCVKLQAAAGAQLAERGDDAGAERAYLRALEVYPEQPTTHYALGKLILRRRDVDGALLHLLAAREQAPSAYYAYETLAPVLELAGRREEALQAYATGSEINPEEFGFRFNYGRLLWIMRRNAEADAVLGKLGQDDSAGIAGGTARALRHELRGALDEAASVYRELLARDDLPAAVRGNVQQRLDGLTGPETR
jgi:tetratricopeptide (TPR) repeat protein